MASRGARPDPWFRPPGPDDRRPLWQADQSDDPIKGRQPAAAILLVLGGVLGLAPLVLPFGIDSPSGWAAYQSYREVGGDHELAAIAILLVAGAGFVLVCLGVMGFVPMTSHRIVGVVTLLVALVSTCLAGWIVVASNFALGGIGLGTYSFFLSGLIGLAGAIVAIVHRTFTP